MATKRNAQTPNGLGSASYRPGISVDARGVEAVDPTKNVEDLVKALEVTLEKLRIADAQRLDDLREADKEKTSDLREADRLRLSEIATLKREYDKQIFDIQTVQVKTTSDLISAQLSKETASLANQINAATIQNQGLIQTLSGRIDKLEQSRYEAAGKSSVADPQLADTLSRMMNATTTLGTNMAEAMTKMANMNAEGLAKLSARVIEVGSMESGGTARRMGQGQLAQWIVMAVMMLAAVAGPIIALRAHP